MPLSNNHPFSGSLVSLTLDKKESVLSISFLAVALIGSLGVVSLSGPFPIPSTTRLPIGGPLLFVD